MITWLKKKFGISDLETEIKSLRNEIDYYETFIKSTMSELKENARLDADIGTRGNNTIILTGVFKKRAYVKFYDMGDGDFEELVKQMHHMKKTALIRHIDKPYSYSGSFSLLDVL